MSGAAPLSSNPTHPAGNDEVGPQPSGLYVLFFAEAWERFSYYGMRALLVLYMTSHLNFDRTDALSVYGTYTGLVYLTPYFGGLLADKFLGRRKAVIIGGLLMMLGHLAMASEALLYYALGLLIVGNGFFKPNMSTIVGGLYKQGDDRRDAGFTIFYMGINLGAFYAPIICGKLGESASFGWHYGFSAAAVGMALGLAVFMWGQKFLGSVGLPPGRVAGDGSPDDKPIGLNLRDWTQVALIVAASTALVVGMVLGIPALRGALGWMKWWYLVLLGVPMIAVPVITSKSSAVEVKRMLVIFILCFFNVFFWMGFEQAGGTMTLFADEQTDRNVGGVAYIVIALFLFLCGYAIRASTKKQPSGQWLWLSLVAQMALAGLYYGWSGIGMLQTGTTAELAASEFQSINPLLIVAFAPFVGNIWTRLDHNPRTRSSSAVKMSIGMAILGVGFIVMYFGQQQAAGGNKIGPHWLFLVYAFHTLGELCLSPIGLSMVTKLSPTRLVSMLMGVWLMSSALANKLAGELEHIVSDSGVSVYAVLIGSSLGAAVLLLALSPVLRQWMHGAEDQGASAAH